MHLKSPPVILLSHGRQEIDARRTMFWYSAFAIPQGTNFEVRDSIPGNVAMNKIL